MIANPKSGLFTFFFCIPTGALWLFYFVRVLVFVLVILSGIHVGVLLLETQIDTIGLSLNRQDWNRFHFLFPFIYLFLLRFKPILYILPFGHANLHGRFKANVDFTILIEFLSLSQAVATVR